MVPACCLEAVGEHARVGEAVLHDLPVALKAEVDEVIVLDQDVGAGASEVERVGLLGAAEVVELEDEVFGEIGFISPDDPTDPGVDKAVFVAYAMS